MNYRLLSAIDPSLNGLESDILPRSKSVHHYDLSELVLSMAIMHFLRSFAMLFSLLEEMIGRSGCRIVLAVQRFVELHC